MMLTRRRLIAISAAMLVLPAIARAEAPAARLWTGQALGARASIRIAHPDGEAIAARVMAEIDRLEGILSLYRADSALSRLNRDGHLDAPPFELLECLSLADGVHRASEGRFDPTVQPLWDLWARAAVGGGEPDEASILATRDRTGWEKVRIDEDRVRLAPGMALTLNGIGQGYVADRVAALLHAEGLTDILIDTGEFRALGGRPAEEGKTGEGWPISLEPGGRVGLRERALATSAPLGTTFDEAGTRGHILDPRTGRPVRSPWRAVSITAPLAAIADAVATAACMIGDRQAMQAMIGTFDGARLEAIA